LAGLTYPFRVIHSDAMCAGCRHRINPATSRLENPLAGYVDVAGGTQIYPDEVMQKIWQKRIFEQEAASINTFNKLLGIDEV